MLPDDLDARLRYEAQRRGAPVAELVREAVGAYLVRDGPPLSFIGLGEGDARTSEAVDEAVAQLVSERHDAEADR